MSKRMPQTPPRRPDAVHRTDTLGRDLREPVQHDIAHLTRWDDTELRLMAAAATFSHDEALVGSTDDRALGQDVNRPGFEVGWKQPHRRRRVDLVINGPGQPTLFRQAHRRQ